MVHCSTASTAAAGPAIAPQSCGLELGQRMDRNSWIVREWDCPLSGSLGGTTVNNWRKLLAALACVVALAASCGGDDGAVSPGGSDSAAAQLQADSTEADSPANGVPAGFEGLPENVYVDGFIPELAHLPVPSPAAFVAGRAFTADEDPRETAVQIVYFLGEPSSVIEFYLSELDDAGYVAESGSFPQTVAEIGELADQGVNQARLAFRCSSSSSRRLPMGSAR